MPAAWRTRGVPSYDGENQHGAPARNIIDIALDPLRWMMSSKLHKYGSAAVLGLLALVYFL